MEFLKSLSPPDRKGLHQDKIWGIYIQTIYIQILEMAGREPRLYIGSGTCVSRGIAGRLAAYENGLDSRHVPRHVWRAFQQMILSFFCGDIIETTSFSDPALSVVGDENGDGEHCSIAIHSD